MVTSAVSTNKQVSSSTVSWYFMNYDDEGLRSLLQVFRWLVVLWHSDTRQIGASICLQWEEDLSLRIWHCVSQLVFSESLAFFVLFALYVHAQMRMWRLLVCVVFSIGWLAVSSLLNGLGVPVICFIAFLSCLLPSYPETPTAQHIKSFLIHLIWLSRSEGFESWVIALLGTVEQRDEEKLWNLRKVMNGFMFPQLARINFHLSFCHFTSMCLVSLFLSPVLISGPAGRHAQIWSTRALVQTLWTSSPP